VPTDDESVLRQRFVAPQPYVAPFAQSRLREQCSAVPCRFAQPQMARCNVWCCNAALVHCCASAQADVFLARNYQPPRTLSTLIAHVITTSDTTDRERHRSIYGIKISNHDRWAHARR
jgi:hypothetical protein